MLALTLARPVEWLQHSPALTLLPRHRRGGTATTIVFFLLVLVLIGIGYLVVRPLALEVRTFLKHWKDYQTALTLRGQSIIEWYQDTFPLETRQWVEVQGR